MWIKSLFKQTFTGTINNVFKYEFPAVASKEWNFSLIGKKIYQTKLLEWKKVKYSLHQLNNLHSIYG